MTDVMTYEQAKKEFINLINSMSNKFTPVQVFTDFVEMAAMSISNSCDLSKKREEREKKYMDLINKYDKKEQEKFPELLGLVTNALTDKFGDFLGNCFETIGASNAKTGQFFTPYSVSKLCAETIFDKDIVQKGIEEKGYIGLNEPACGSGGMIIAFLDVLYHNGFNFQTQSYTIAQDIDYRCAYMCYIQLSLLGAPAVVCIGDTLALKTWDTLYTPFYVMNWWKFNRKTAPVKEATAQAVEVMNEPATDEITLKDNKNNDIKAEKPVEEITPPEVTPVMEDLKQGQLSLF